MDLWWHEVTPEIITVDTDHEFVCPQCWLVHWKATGLDACDRD